jgi:hypothetical protein
MRGTSHLCSPDHRTVCEDVVIADEELAGLYAYCTLTPGSQPPTHAFLTCLLAERAALVDLFLVAQGYFLNPTPEMTYKLGAMLKAVEAFK